ncbi:MAG: CooT family nickel-binding protein [Desulfotignum sp.]|nr:CooT family nickel-binding protein [Desulfotignum sp.]
MCEASAYMIQDGKETLVLESVDLVEPLDEGGLYAQ